MDLWPPCLFTSNAKELEMFVFAHSWIFLLAPLPLLIWFLVPPRRIQRPVLRVPFLYRVQQSLDEQSKFTRARQRTVPLTIKMVVYLLLITSLARPQWLDPPVSRELPSRDLLLLVDLSGSMEQKDFTNSVGEQVDRLTAVKEVLGDFLLKRDGDRVGLVVFGNGAFLQAPFTTDLQLCHQLLEETEVRMAGPKTALGDAIGLGVHLFDQSEAPAKTIIALTDGNDTASQVPPVEAAKVARDRDITIYTVAMGDPETVGEEKLDVDSLKQVAAETQGEFFLALNHSELQNIYTKLDEIETREVKVESYRPRIDLFYWPLLAAFLISLLDRAIQLWRSRRHVFEPAEDVRLHVSPVNFDLEVKS